MSDTIRVSTPDELLAVVESFLGFTPEESIMLAGVNGDGHMSRAARYSYDDWKSDPQGIISEFEDAATIAAVFAAVYHRSTSADDHHDAMRRTAQVYEFASVQVLDALVVDDLRWWDSISTRSGAMRDVAQAHTRMSAQSSLPNTVGRTRDDMAATVKPGSEPDDDVAEQIGRWMETDEFLEKMGAEAVSSSDPEWLRRAHAEACRAVRASRDPRQADTFLLVAALTARAMGDGAVVNECIRNLSPDAANAAAVLSRLRTIPPKAKGE